MQCYEMCDESLTCFNIAVCNFLSHILSRTVVKCLSSFVACQCVACLSPFPFIREQKMWTKKTKNKNKKVWLFLTQYITNQLGHIKSNHLTKSLFTFPEQNVRVNKWCSCHLYHSVWLWKSVGEILLHDCLADAVRSAMLAVCLYMSSLLCFPTILSRVLADFSQKVIERRGGAGPLQNMPPAQGHWDTTGSLRRGATATNNWIFGILVIKMQTSDVSLHHSVC